MQKVLITNSSGITRFKFLTKSRYVYLSIVIPAGMLESSATDGNYMIINNYCTVHCFKTLATLSL